MTILNHSNGSADRGIAEDVIRSLARSPGLRAARLVVQVTDGQVVISGLVQSRYERAAAARTALQVEGVVSVTDRMTVGLVGTASDTSPGISAQVRPQLSLVARNGRVEVVGEARSWPELEEAGSAVWSNLLERKLFVPPSLAGSTMRLSGRSVGAGGSDAPLPPSSPSVD